MSLLKSFGRFLGRNISRVGALTSMVPGPIGAVSRIATPLASRIAPVVAGTAVGAALPTAGRVVTGAIQRARTIPGAGAVAGAAAGYGVGQLMEGQRRRRRGRGFSARDVRQTRRMLRLIGEMSKSVPTRPRGMSPCGTSRRSSCP